MINTESFIARLETLFEYYSLSASAFADKIGVQRSGLSHLLSGRNKPSLDFILKITEHFPDVDLYWLLNGKGSFPKKDKTHPDADTPSPPVPQTGNGGFMNTEDIIEKTAGQATADEEIERIVIFFKDGSFKSYNPQK